MVLLACSSGCTSFKHVEPETNSVFLKPLGWLQVIGVELESVVLQALDGSQAELKLDAEEKRNPVLVSSTLCADAVLKVSQPGLSGWTLT